ncbi:hypothetical protein OC834_007224 [Tilletia horrida]|nr:hypothetical protein OC834_007224 [Tilletia horrida]
MSTAAPVLSRSGKDNKNGNGNTLADGILDGFFGNAGGKGGNGSGPHLKNKRHAEARQHPAEPNTAKAAAATLATTKLNIDAARTNAHHKDADIKKDERQKAHHRQGRQQGGRQGRRLWLRPPLSSE